MQINTEIKLPNGLFKSRLGLKQHLKKFHDNTEQPKKKLKTFIDPSKLKVLEEHFEVQQKNSRQETTNIAQKLNLPREVVRQWFQSQRTKSKKVIREK